MIEITTSCRQCGEEWSPDHSDFVRGTWKTCRRCRDGPHTTQDPQTGVQARSGAHSGSQDDRRETST